MKIDIWSDIVCPFCYIGKRHLEAALAARPDGGEVEIVWHSFELDPTPSDGATDLTEALMAKFGASREQIMASQRDLAARAAEAGLTFNWQDAKAGNTLDAHRLVHAAQARGQGARAHERFMHAYFTEGLDITDADTLVGLAAEVGVPEQEAREVLAGDRYTEAVRADEQQAAQLGVRGVPFFVIDGRLGISGAQPVESFTRAFDQAWGAAGPIVVLEEGEACGPGGCEIPAPSTGA